MVYITGDTHGDLTRFEDKAFKQLNSGDIVIVCGDFGFIWDDSKKEKKELRKLSKKKYTICFIDGTHENFELLYDYPEEEWNGGEVHKIADNIFHLKRGQIFRMNDLSFFTMGGGISPDLDYRFDTENWSKHEVPNRQEMLEGAQNLDACDLKVDVILTHEPAAKIKSFLMLHDDMSSKMRVTAFNNYLEEISQSVTYSKWYFGSLHKDKHISSTNIAVFKKLLVAKTGETI